MRLSGRIAWITGSGSGIGQSSALHFASEGATVIVHDLTTEKAQTTADLISQAGGNCMVQVGDVTQADDMERIAAAIMERYGRIDVLFNNAGISSVGALHEIDGEAWDRVMNVNVRGVYLASAAVLPYMMKQESGVIIQMSSCIAEIGLARRAAYAASKGAVLALTKSMQVDYAAYNIRVNAILPGTVLTPFVEDYLATSYDDPQAAIEQLKKRQLGGELVTPAAVAKAAVFLASDDASFVMGSPFYVDGGVVFGKNA